MTGKKKFRRTHRKNALGEMILNRGGKTYEESTAAALENLEVIRADAEESILAELEKLTELVESFSSRASSDSQARLREILNQMNGILTLAGTFDYRSLDLAAKSMCRLLFSMIKSENHSALPLKLHVDTMVLCRRDKNPAGDPNLLKLVAELEPAMIRLGYAPVFPEDTVLDPVAAA